MPVLSTHRTDTAPRVSTDGIVRTSELFRASRHAPIDRKTVSTTGNSSGIIAIARVIPDKTLSISLSVNDGIVRFIKVINVTSANSTMAITAQTLTSLFVCF